MANRLRALTLLPHVTTSSKGAAQPLLETPQTLAYLYGDSWKKYQSQQRIKKWFDRTLACIGLLILLPVLVMLAMLVKLTSPGPILYKSLRIGLQGQPFYMLKFRTMHMNADQLREQLRREAKLEGNLFKIPHDPRVTPLGRWLRKFSLDEFPQLLNVLLGDMSLVGPRPLPPDESRLFKAPYTLRFQVLPGITGVWQVSGRSKLSFQQLCNLEMNYVIHWKLWDDIKILAQTLPAVLKQRGAY